MPIFEFNRRKCKHRFETIVFPTREKLVCPKCASNALDKQLSVFSSPASGKENTSAGGCACTPQTCGCH